MNSKKVIVIGAGPAGYPTAFKLSELGADVTVIEKNQVGGVCLNWGCIPSKTFLDSAHRFHILDSLKDFTTDASEKSIQELRKNLNWDKIQQRRKTVIAKLQAGLTQIFKAKKINLINAEASFLSSNEMQIKTSEKTFTEKFDYAVIAAGTESFFPPPFDKHQDICLDNKSVFELNELPKSIVIIGGGVIGVEFACFFNALGTKVDIIEVTDNILPNEDDAVIRTLKNSLIKRGINIHTSKKTKDIAVAGNIKTVILEDGQKIETEQILVAAGRAAKLENLGLENINISWNNKGIKTDDTFRAGPENIYVIGDINGQMQLAHAATAQGVFAAFHIAGQKTYYDNNLVPKCIYTWPEVATIGLNKQQAEEKNKEVKVQKAFFMSNGRALASSETEGFVQIVSEKESGKILGAQIVGHTASEMIHIFSVAIKARLTTKNLKEIIFAHPAMSETIHEALER